MAVSGPTRWFGRAFLAALNKEIDIDSDTIKMMLCTSSFTPNQDTMDYKNDVTAEVTGEGYTAGGQTLTGVSIAYNGTNNTITIDCNDVVWENATITASYAVIYDDTPGTEATKPLLGYISFAEPVSSTAGDFTVTIDSAGLLTLEVGA